MVARIEVTKTMLISLVIPVVALIIGAVTVGEQITISILLGSLAILSGIAMILVNGRTR
jgi:drug/metabolite transporter (DMT)-like permease